jgi:hypothetical protein
LTTADVDAGDCHNPNSMHALNHPLDDATAPSSPRGIVLAVMVAA